MYSVCRVMKEITVLLKQKIQNVNFVNKTKVTQMFIYF